MCGIFGILDRSTGDHHAAMKTMRGGLVHRGPDDSGMMVWSPEAGPISEHTAELPKVGNAFLGHNRLSIIDLSKAGHQPMSTNDNRLHISFNGELYNFRELREELRSRYEFRSNSDTEVVLAAWREWGTGCVKRFRGMFAFVILDSDTGTCWLVRDHAGIKPLYYVHKGGMLAFASEIPTLVKAGLTSREIEPNGLYDYLRHALVNHTESTLVSDIRQLPPASIARYDLLEESDLRIDRYWEPPRPRMDMEFQDVVNDLSTRFRRSVELHLRSDVPVGVALSGGIDSSAIACVMRELQGPTQEIHAFSYLADDPRLNEEAWIDRAAAKSGVIVHKVGISPDVLLAEADDLILSQGEPFGSLSIFAQRKVFEEASNQGIRVVLDGQGADELFGGYKAYIPSDFAELVRSGRFISAARLVKGVLQRPDTRARLDKAAIAQTLAGVLPAKYRSRLMRGAGAGEFPEWMNEQWFSSQGVLGSSPQVSTTLDESLIRAFVSTNLPSLLRYDDLNSMRFSIESRVPFLDVDLVDAVFQYPRDAIMGAGGVTKKALRESLRGTVPDSILDRSDKIGFDAPERVWLEPLAPWVEGVLKSDSMDRLPGLNKAACLDHWAAMKSGEARFDWRYWRWVNAVRWAELLDLTCPSDMA